MKTLLVLIFAATLFGCNQKPAQPSETDNLSQGGPLMMARGDNAKKLTDLLKKAGVKGKNLGGNILYSSNNVICDVQAKTSSCTFKSGEQKLSLKGEDAQYLVKALIEAKVKEGKKMQLLMLNCTEAFGSFSCMLQSIK